MGWFSRGILAGVSKTTLLSWYEVKGCIFFLFCDVFRRIATQKQLFLVGWEIALHWEWKFFVCMQRFWTLETICVAWSKLPGSLVRQGIFQSVALYYTSHATSQAEPARSRAVASQAAPCNLAGKACSVTGCRPIKRQSPTASYVSELPTKQREFVFLHGL